jgi:hypothetical protein
MPNWCANRVEIHCPPIHTKDIVRFAKGEIDPYLSKTIKASIKLFIAGCAGLLKPVRPIQYSPFPDLLRHGVGEVNDCNSAFHDWLHFLQANSDLTKETCEQILTLYAKTGLSDLAWNQLSEVQQACVAELFKRKNDDWFGFVLGKPPSDEGMWQSLNEIPDKAIPFDMRYLIATQLAAEINGFNGKLFAGIIATYDLYIQLYDVKWPVGESINVQERGEGLVIVDFDTPWGPPAQEVFQRLSGLYQCRILHYFSERGMGYCGFAEYVNACFVNGASDNLQYGQEDDDGACDIVAPEYIVGNVAHYGG